MWDIAYAREHGIRVLGIRDYGDRGVVGVCGVPADPDPARI